MIKSGFGSAREESARDSSNEGKLSVACFQYPLAFLSSDVVALPHLETINYAPYQNYLADTSHQHDQRSISAR